MQATGVISRLRSVFRSKVAIPLFMAAVTLALLLVGWQRATRWYQSQLLAEQRARTSIDVSLRGTSLASSIHQRLAVLRGLAAFIQVSQEEPEPALRNHFNRYASVISARTNGLRLVSVAPEGVLTYVFPPEHLSRLEGVNLLESAPDDSAQALQQAIRSGEIMLGAPFEDGQEHWRLAARQAVYKPDSSLWGLVSIVIEMPMLVSSSGLEEAGEMDYSIMDSNGRIVYGKSGGDQAIYYRIEMPGGAWYLVAAPRGGWLASIERPLSIFRTSGLIIVLLLSALVYLIAERQGKLSYAVQTGLSRLEEANLRRYEDIAVRQQVEAALQERETQYRSVFDSVSDGLFINSLSGRLVDFNPAAAAMHGYTVEEFRSLQPEDFIHPESFHLFGAYMGAVKDGGQFRTRSLDIRKDGTSFYVEVLGTAFLYKGKPHTLAVVRDISEQVEAYQLLEKRVEERTRELSTLLDVSRNMTSTLELRPLLTLILEQLHPVVDYSTASLLMLQGESGDLVTLEKRGQPSTFLADFRPRCPDQFTEPVLTGGRPLIIGDAASEGYSDTPAAWMGVPLIVKDRITGMLVLEHPDLNFYTPRHADLALVFANQAAAAIENARLYEQAQELAALQERQKLARELHDSVSQALYGIALGTRTALALLERDPSQAFDPLQYVLNLTEAGLAEMRALIFELRPESIEAEGLVAALSKSAAALQARHGLQVEAEIPSEPSLSLHAKQALHRIAQEALHNAVKHARGSRVALRLIEESDWVALEVEDDGVGFDPGGSFPGHLGLRSMRERAERLGGWLEVHSAPGEGTLVRARLPAQPPVGEG